MSRITSLHKAIRLMGSQEKLAKACGYSQPTISAWIKRNKQASVRGAVLIEKVTQGKIKKWELRPDIFEPEE